MIKQFVQSAFCLDKCRLCCKFSQQESVWSPALLNEEAEEFLKKGFPPAIFSQNKKIRLESLPGSLFACPFLEAKVNKCTVYESRPFECRLYPFLINRRKGKIYLSVDPGCLFVKENSRQVEFKNYVSYLEQFLQEPAQLSALKANPQIVQSYADAEDLLELNFS